MIIDNGNIEYSFHIKIDKYNIAKNKLNILKID